MENVDTDVKKPRNCEAFFIYRDVMYAGNARMRLPVINKYNL